MSTTSHRDQPEAFERVIRVFVSSTFRDMMRERDLLVKEVFPALRRKCASRFVTFTEVDLRWGITEAQANEGQVLPLCLAEIERSRPYFIGLLGERYGWIPDTIRPDVVEREHWLREHVQGRTSVTELEILYGVLRNPEMGRHAYFYFRAPAYVNDPALTEDERREMSERDIAADIESHGPVEAARRTDARKARLAALKQRIRDSGLPLVEPYAHPRVLARVVRRQLNRLIDQLYPEAQTPDPVAQERMAHEAHARSRLFACIDRPEHRGALNAFAGPAEHDGRGLVVTGVSGGGKTALLATWVRDWRRDHPDDFVFQQYFGATPGSSSAEGFLRRLLSELRERYGIADSIPSDPEALRDALPGWLTRTGGNSRIFLVLDGLDQMQGSEPDVSLQFLPTHFPPHVGVFASALPGPALDALRERGWAVHELPLATEAEVDLMVGEYFRIHGRHVDADGHPIQTDLRRQLVSSPGTKNPLFLRTVLEELRQFGSFDQLPQRVHHYLEACTPKDLFLRVLRRWREDFDARESDPTAPTRALVDRALTHLWAARQGLSEPEWLDLLGDASQPLPRVWWSPLFLALEPHLSRHSGLFAFGHDFLREAVETACVPSGELQQRAHRAVADYFDRQPASPRKIVEGPWQDWKAGNWPRLEATLTSFEQTRHLGRWRPHDWEMYWRTLVDTGTDVEQAYQGAWNRWQEQLPTDDARQTEAAWLGDALYTIRRSGAYRASVHFNELALGLVERTQNWLREEPITLALSEAYQAMGDHAKAEELVRRLMQPTSQKQRATAERVAAELNVDLSSIREPSSLRETIALSRSTFGRHDGTAKSELVNRTVARIMAHQTGAMASRASDTGHPVDAAVMLREVVDVLEELEGPDARDISHHLNNLGLALKRQDRFAEAEGYYRRALAIDRRFRGPRDSWVAMRLRNLGAVLAAQGRLDDAKQHTLEAIEIDEAVFGFAHPSVALGWHNYAEICKLRGDLEAAELAYRKALAAEQQSHDPGHTKVKVRMQNLAILLAKRGNVTEARQLSAAAARAGGTVRSKQEVLSALGAMVEIGDAQRARAALLPKLDLRKLPPSCQRLLMALFQLGLGGTVWVWSLVGWGRLGAGWAVAATVVLLGAVPINLLRCFLRPSRIGTLLVAALALGSGIGGGLWLYLAATGAHGPMSAWTAGTWIRATCSLMQMAAGSQALRLVRHPAICAFRDERRRQRLG